MKEQESSYRQVALKFATALQKGRFEEARAYLSTALRQKWTQSLLQETYEEMVGYFEIPPDTVSVDIVDTEMPRIEPGSAWVYVSIVGERNAEAVTVIVGNEDNTYLIQDLEWGRP
jgi:hypothetical protein